MCHIATNKNISLIVAMAENRAIGVNNSLLYRLPNDMRRFRTITTGHTIIMGRRTYESLPHGALPNRRNIVLSTTAPSTAFPNCETYHSLEEALQQCPDGEEVIVIGGAQLYRAAMPYATRIYLTLVHHTPTNADTFFPQLTPDDWTITEEEHYTPDSKHNYSYSFLTLLRK